MTGKERIRLALCHPRQALAAAGYKWARYLVTRQVLRRFHREAIPRFPRDHYGWQELQDDFEYSLFCTQESNLLSFLQAHAPARCQTAIEVGAASDLFLRTVAAEHKIGVNVIPVCVENLQRQGIEGRLSVGPLIPASDGEADLLICFQTLEHVTDPIGFLRELARILKADGTLVLSIPFVFRTQIRQRFYGQAADRISQPEGEFHVFEFTPSDFSRILSHTPFTQLHRQILVNYRLCYDPLSNACIRRFFAPDVFCGLLAVVLKKG